MKNRVIVMKKIILYILIFLNMNIYSQQKVKSGIDVLMEEYQTIIIGKKIGLITNQTGVNSDLVSTVDILNKNFDLIKLFAPEHGVRGEFYAGEYVSQYNDEITGLPVYSLYGNTKKPTKKMLKNLDVLIYDIQDIGIRTYTYIYTMSYCMEAAAENGIKFVVLDRPNPLSGNLIDGNILEEEDGIGICFLKIQVFAGFRLLHIFRIKKHLFIVP